jgi:hypothetical protein
MPGGKFEGGEFEGSVFEGGDSACWAHLVCPECGAMESGGHREGCPVAAAEVDPATSRDSA